MKNLKVIMATKDMTLNKLSEETGLSKQLLSGFRNGKGNPTLETLEKVAKALEVEVKDLF